MFLVAGTTTSVYLWLFALFQLGCGQDIVFRDETTYAHTSEPGSPVAPLSSFSLANRYCLAPPQPDHGEWRLQEDFCEEGIADCKVPEGTKLASGYQLTYNCADGYKTNGSNIFYCRPNGHWSHIPECKEILCEALNTVSRTGLCRRDGIVEDCDAPVPPRTQAEVSCRPGYTTDSTLSTPGTVKQILNCNSDGIWVPQPIRCVQVCGRVSTDGRPFSMKGKNASVSEFPWHVSLYKQRTKERGKKELFCMGTIIHTNFVITDSACLNAFYYVHTFSPTIFVTAGNTFGDYDHPMHDPDIVKTTTVKRVWTLDESPYSYIALLELEEPFVFSGILLPACLVGSALDSSILDPGDNETMVGFGVTMSSLYVAYSGCNVSELTHYPKDKFCARPDVYENDKRNSGGGLVSQMNDQWHVIGVADFFEFGPDDVQIDIIYTRVSYYLGRIRKIISDYELQQLHPSSNSNSNSPETPTCLTSPQPENGELKYHPTQCPALNQTNSDCRVPQGIELVFGTRLVFTCNPGYERSFLPEDIRCSGGEYRSSELSCYEIRCNAFDSASTIAKCIRHQSWVNCSDSVLPGTQAKLSCRPGYSADWYSTSMRTTNTQCSKEGKWLPHPIECVPACGLTTTKTDFPWRASLYRVFPGSDEKVFRCGATIIHRKLVLTAASCVFDKETNSTIDSEKLFVQSGNRFHNYDHSRYEPEDLSRSAVKAVHISGDYNGKHLVGDIALVEIQDPFEFSDRRLPACLDDFNSGNERLDPDAYGSLEEIGDIDVYNFSVQSIRPSIKTVPYVPYDRCKLSDEIAVEKSHTSDKFCAGYKNESEVCVRDRGGGLVFKKHDSWYVMGIITEVPAITVEESTVKCNDYAICTNVSMYIPWIEEEIFNLERRESQASSSDEKLPSRLGVSIDRPDNGKTPSENENPFCSAPPQPKNGNWMLHQSLCSHDAECENLPGARLRHGTQLVYRCSPGYVAIGNTEVWCGFDGNLSAIPSCTEIKCDSLNSESTAASCYDRYGKWVICDPAVPPGTRAEVSCRPGYKEETSVTTFRRETVRCGENGKWTPDPIRCEAICGVATTHQTPFIINGTAARLSDFPWHATLYQQNNSPTGVRKDFICGGTIIHTNFVLTAAHCVYSEQSETTTDPEKLFVMTGNVFREYDFPHHDSSVVKTSAVEYVHRPCKYHGLRGNYASDVALLELKTPFIFSNILSPACLDVEGHSQQVLEPGALGKVAGFGRTETGEPSGLLLTLTLPYVSYDQCKTSKHAEKNDILITPDKFCAGYTDGSAVCEGDSGGGLVFRKSELYYVLGIVSLGLGVDFESGEKTCDRYSYSLYTKVSDHMRWIQDVMLQRAQHNIHPPCH